MCQCFPSSHYCLFFLLSFFIWTFQARVKFTFDWNWTHKAQIVVVMAWALKLPLTDEVIESGLVQDFDASLSGIGQELGAGAYSMRYVNTLLFTLLI